MVAAAMPSTTTATVTYKKKDGGLTVSDDTKYLFYTPAAPPKASPSVTIPIADITNLQQTPAGKPTVALKIVIKEDNYVFTFTHASNARREQEAITDLLRNTIAANKASTTAQLAPSAPGTVAGKGDVGQPAAMAIAKAVSSSKGADEGWYDDSKLKSDVKLQKSLLESDKVLSSRFNQSLREKPESVSVSQFTNQFWSTRLHLLRAHAIETAQNKGEYNVLPEIKFTRKAAERAGDPDTKQLQITKEQIKLIFKQYPVVKDAYNENSPPLDPVQFWTRFFGSRLLKKLKGERIMDQDPRDPILDKYLDRREAGFVSNAHIPHFMDLEGNEQNHSQRKGNRPDQDMRPSSYEKVPILRVLNNLSEKMMSHVTPEDGEAHAPIGLDEETFEQLRLRDLANEDVDNRLILNIKEQQRHHDNDDEGLSADARRYAKQNPARVLATLHTDLEPSNLGSDKQGTLRLDKVIGYRSEDDEDSEDDANRESDSVRASRIGSRVAVRQASRTIMNTIKSRNHTSIADYAARSGLSQTILDSLTMTHNTTIEFLHYFWTIFLSGDASRVAELEQLVSTLDRSLDRLNAVGTAADAERAAKIDAMKKQVQDWQQRTGKKRRVDYEAEVPGGRKVVEAIVRPTVRALAQATTAYRNALEEQTRDADVTPKG